MSRAIRTATEADAPAIARLHLSSYRAAYRGLLPDGFLAAYDPAEREHRWRERLRDPSRTTFVTTPAMVAFAETGPSHDVPHTGELLALHVAESHWRQGIGGALHAHALNALSGLGYESAVLWVLDGNRRACAFYEAAGWAFTGETRRRTVRGTAVDELRYRRELRPRRSLRV
ncbi:GNAT family N-acetyltransferase [Actinomadura nitritigenes]|uniref:GNAT family N-acetyltransferase n=1 Tax=Actinomadura nitritigenes TaxID=134602 RepID=A0ABS3R6D2_9ACTN|nr:GNAT family N-acetyltransferase [Actinomadura nitritigenes]MBO2441706.1 GNAT family N-acetyltransferase [Actinomadura nitritigenes]